MKKYIVHVEDNGTIRWQNKKGKLHREDGPALEYANGSKFWHVNGKLHRLDKPAIECVNGDKYWYQKGIRHRLDGPAIEWSDGCKRWYINGKEFTEEEFDKQVDGCEGKVVEIDGVKYKLTQA